MPRPHATALALALLAPLASASSASDPIAESRDCLAKGDPRAAVRLLEEAVPEADEAALPTLLDALREAYAKALDRASAEGKTREADLYREALALLDRSRPRTPAPKAVPAPGHPEPASIPSPQPVPGPQPEARPVPPVILDLAPRERPETPPAALAPIPDLAPSPSPKPTPAIDDRKAKLAEGDRAWKEKRYLDAGAVYGALAEANHLPPARNDHWAYCRLVAVLERINNEPRTPAEWAEIHAEIDHIRLLAPKNWYSMYLRNVVIERSGGIRPADPGKVVLRGAAPDEAPSAKSATVPARRGAQTRPISRPSLPAPVPAEIHEPEPEAEVGRPGPAVGRWKTFVTPNFRILHDDEALARKVAAKAEAARREAARFWTGAEPRTSWTPACDLYLYPTAAIFAAETRQSPESPGFSTAGLSGGRVTARMVKLRADYAKMIDAVLPHEVTHIVLADLFSTAQVPRWADEGMAVLSEPLDEQALRARDLAEPLNRDVLFGLDVLMTTDYPDGSHWALYYAQSVSLTRYLVGLGTAPQFVQFVKLSQGQGADAALKQVYRIDGLADLETRWKDHARRVANPAVASAGTEAAPAADATRR